MKNTVDILRFLFQDSQEQSELESYLQEVADAEKPGDVELKTLKSPLAAALKKVGVDMAEFELEEAPEQGGFCLSTGNADVFKKAIEQVRGPDGMHGLAELGWLATAGGDQEGTDAEGRFEIYLVNITGDEEASDTEELSDVSKLAKDSYEFVHDPLPDREDIKVSSPEIATDANQKGKEKAIDGEQPKGTPKGMKKESWGPRECPYCKQEECTGGCEEKRLHLQQKAEEKAKKSKGLRYEALESEWPNAGWWKQKEERARGMSIGALHHSRVDCDKAARANPETEGKYRDEGSIYAKEQSRRRNLLGLTKSHEALERAREILGEYKGSVLNPYQYAGKPYVGYQPNKLKPDEIHPGVKHPRWMTKGKDQSRAVDREIGRRIEQAKAAKAAKHSKAS